MVVAEHLLHLELFLVSGSSLVLDIVVLLIQFYLLYHVVIFQLCKLMQIMLNIT